MKDEPNRLIRELLKSRRVPTEEETKKILDHIVKAPFSSREMAVIWYNNDRLSGVRY